MIRHINRIVVNRCPLTVLLQTHRKLLTSPLLGALWLTRLHMQLWVMLVQQHQSCQVCHLHTSQ